MATSSVPYAAEKQIAIAAVRRACVLTASVFNTLVKQETLTKDDSSPVTGASLSFTPPHDRVQIGLQWATTPRRRS